MVAALNDKKVVKLCVLCEGSMVCVVCVCGVWTHRLCGVSFECGDKIILV